VIDYATYCQIRALDREQKLRVGQIAQQLQLDKKTVRYWLQHDYDRHRDFEHPDHARPLLEQRLKAREQHLLHRFLSLCPQAPDYYQQLQQRRLNARHHVQKILALVEIYGADKVSRALQDTHQYQAYSCEYIANILEQRARPIPEPGALHLTRACDLLELDLPQPDLSVYEGQVLK
jgi:hypothetical protein